MEKNEAPSAVDIVRCVATARVTMPRSVVRLSAGRLNFSLTDQVLRLCFLSMHPVALQMLCQMQSTCTTAPVFIAILPDWILDDCALG